VLQPYSKSKLELKSNLSKICQLIASLSTIQPQFNIKLKLKYLKSGFKCKKKDITHTIFFASLKFDFFRI